MVVTPTRQAYQLMHEGAIALAAVESNGLRIDVDYLKRTIDETTELINQLTEKLKSDEVYSTWRKIYGVEASLGSRAQLAHVVFEVMKFPFEHYTSGGGDGKKGRPSATEEVLEKVKIPFVKDYLRLQKLVKLRSTNLRGVLHETVDGVLRPVFNLHSLLTFRSSSSSPNFQNLPIRDPELGKLIRSAFIPRENHLFVEVDLKSNEVRVGCCYSRDERLIEDTVHGDMHRDMATECYLLPVDAVPKNVRYEVKSNFVFASFYGSYFAQTALALWEAIELNNLKTKDGRSLYEHLVSKGITELGENLKNPAKGTFADHIRQVEDRFWNERFRVHNQWRQNWWRSYCKCGYFLTLSGFLVQGVYTKNQVINSPVQGSAFHCLLWVLIELHKWLQQHKMRSMIVGQIHDSIEMDVHEDELQDVLAMTNWLITVGIRRAWPWVIVPLEGEVEASPLNWFEKKPIESR